ncbi:MAG TPA: fibronectin type III-like domain-contianing protein, partial [Puia sp.]|nr:fibronectin type III-like domain-contianing protein [Puia sp.]
SDLPSYRDYGMKGRTYRYYPGPVQYPFGYGLSYTSFGYTWQRSLKKTAYTARDTLSFSISVNNTGAMDGDEVVQAYIQYPSMERMPVEELKAFRRASIARNGTRELQFSIPLNELQKWDLSKGRWNLYPGTYKIVLGSNSRDEKLSAAFTVK